MTDYPKEIKAFYMKKNADDKTMQGTDVLFPRIGEIIGGSVREENYDKLVAEIEARGMKASSYDWYLDTRRYGSCPHGGFGLGFERLILFVTGIREHPDVYPAFCAEERRVLKTAELSSFPRGLKTAVGCSAWRAPRNMTKNRVVAGNPIP